MSTLLQIRTRFVQAVGDYSLVTDIGTYADNGANNWINDAQKKLDEHFEHPRNRRLFSVAFAALGATYVDITKTKFIEAVYLTHTSLTAPMYMEYNPLYRYVYESANSTTTQSSPTCWTFGQINVDPDHVVAPVDYVSTRIQFDLPVDKTYTVNVVGQFYSTDMSSDSDHSFWTDSYPTLLMWQAIVEYASVRENLSKLLDKAQKQLELLYAEVEKSIIEAEIGFETPKVYANYDEEYYRGIL